MTPFAYVVSMHFADDTTCARWREWLLQEHLADVLRAGAETAELVVADSCTLHCHYRFPSAEHFARYESDDAPRLRAHGLERVAQGDVVRFARYAGAVEVPQRPA